MISSLSILRHGVLEYQPCVKVTGGQAAGLGAEVPCKADGRWWGKGTSPRPPQHWGCLVLALPPTCQVGQLTPQGSDYPVVKLRSEAWALFLVFLVALP